MSRLLATLAIATEGTGLGIAIYALAFEVIPAEGILALLATLTAGMVGWSQSRRYAELVEPYSYASESLQELRERFIDASSEESFRELVNECEHAISREHQMWQIRRGVTPRKHMRSD